MLGKTGRSLVRALALVFTTVVAPIAVNVVVHDMNAEESGTSHVDTGVPRKEESPISGHRIAVAFPALAPSGQSAPQQPSTTTTIQPATFIKAIVQSTGHTSDEALQQALRIALYKATVAEFGSDAWALSGPAVFTDAWRNMGGLVRSWKTVAVTKEWKEGEELYRADVTIEIDRRALQARLYAASTH